MSFPDWLADLLTIAIREVEPTKRVQLLDIAHAAASYVTDTEDKLLNAQEEASDRLDYIMRLEEDEYAREWYGEVPDFDDEEVV